MNQYQIYIGKDGFWRWRYLAANGRVIADSGEGYHNKSDCLNGIAIMKGSGNDPIYEV